MASNISLFFDSAGLNSSAYTFAAASVTKSISAYTASSFESYPCSITLWHFKRILGAMSHDYQSHNQVAFWQFHSQQSFVISRMLQF